MDKNLILTILNYILERSKKTAQPNLPLEGFTKALEQQNEILEYLKAVKQDRGLNGARMPVKETNLFEREDLKEQRRFELIKAIATGYHPHDNNSEPYNYLNDNIITIADNLLAKFYQSQKVTK